MHITSIEFKKNIVKGKGAHATLPIINKSKLENLIIPVSQNQLMTNKPSYKKLECTLKLKLKSWKPSINRKINDLEELKKSILQKAFNGELKTA